MNESKPIDLPCVFVDAHSEAMRYLFRGARISAALSERFELYIKIARPCGRREPCAASRPGSCQRLHTELHLTAPNRGRPSSAAFSQAGLRSCAISTAECCHPTKRPNQPNPRLA